MKGLTTLVFLLLTIAPLPRLTADGVITSPGDEGFNTGLSLVAHKSTPRPGNGIRTVVIDAGHGGRDPGGMGMRSEEKTIALNVALLLRDGIEAHYPEVEVIMTREDDTFVPLGQRAQLANEEGADLFISIHANIASSLGVSGTETFVMGNHVNEYNLRIAKRENAALRYEENGGGGYGFDPNSNEGHILANVHQGENMERSILFAAMVERAFADHGRASRGVKQAGFVVLKATTMPSVLVELGFMSNKREESYLLSKGGQKELAESLLEAFGEYHAEMGGVSLANTPTPYGIQVNVGQEEPSGNSNNTITASGPDPAPVRVPAKQKPALALTTQAREQESPTAGRPVSYRLQLAALSKPTDIKRHGWDRLPYPVVVEEGGGYYRYQLTGFHSCDEARRAAQELKDQGTKTSLTAYRGRERLDGAALRTALR